MAQRRMFSKEITNSSDFLMMSQSAQSLYFHIGMNADDDGFCEVFTVMRMTDSKPDDLSVLHAKNFIYLHDSKVCIVKDWHKNNMIRKDRYTPSKYLDDDGFKEIYLTIMDEKVAKLDQYKDLKIDGKPMVNQRLPQGSIGKGSIGKVKLPKGNSKAEYGNKDINKCIDYLKEKLDGSLDGSIKSNRNYCHLLLKRFKKDYPDKDSSEQVCRLIDFASRDDFHAKNITGFRYLYNNAQKIIQTVKGSKNKITIIG